MNKNAIYPLHSDANAAFMKTTYLLLSAISFVLTSLGLEVDLRYILLAIGGSLAGSFILAYFRREKSWFDICFKIIVSAVAGLISGGVVVKFYSITEAEYVAGVYAVCACLVLFFMRSIVGLAESNAGTIVTTVFQRVFNVQQSPKLPKGPRPRGSRRGPLPSVVPEDSMPPDIQIIETITERKEEKL